MQVRTCLLTLTAALSQALPQMQDRNVLIACFGAWSSWCRPMPRVCGKCCPLAQTIAVPLMIRRRIRKRSSVTQLGTHLIRRPFSRG